MGFIDEKGLKRTLKAIDEQIQTSKVTPDWNASPGKNEYIKNRTHYFYHMAHLDKNMLTSDVFVASYDIYVTYRDQGFFKLNKNDSTKVSFGGPEITICHQFVDDTSTHLVYVDDTNGGFGYYVEGIDIIGVKELDEMYIPDSITRNTQLEELKTRMIELTYSELVSLRNDSKLIPGMQYRIIDYVTTTSQSNTRVTNKKFDIIVTALNEHSLCEDAHATHHDGNNYWNDIEKWEIKYDIDNDTLTYEWISNTDIPVLKKLGSHPSNSLGFTYLGTEICDFSNYDIYGDIETHSFSCNDGKPDVKVFIYDAKYYRVVDGIPNEYLELELYLPSKGVIYYMKDEFGNEAGYDFKNILFMRACGLTNLVINIENSQSLSVKNIYELERNMHPFIPTCTNLEDFTVPYIYKDNIYKIDLDYKISNELYRAFYHTFNDATDKASDASINGKSHNNIIKPNYTPSSSKCRRLNNTIFIGECFDNKLELFNYENTIYNSNKITMNSSCGNNIICKSSNININNDCNRNVVTESKYINIGTNSRFNHFYLSQNIVLGVLNECNILWCTFNTILENNCYCINTNDAQNNVKFSNSNTFKAMCNRISCNYLRACTIEYNSGILGVNGLYNSHIKNINGEISTSTNTSSISEISLDLTDKPTENITISKNSAGEIKVYCEADLIA